MVARAGVFGATGGIVDRTAASDEELVARLAHQDHKALETLYDRYSRILYSLGLRILKESARAEEVVQDVFLKLWQKPHLYIPENGAFSHWLLRVTRNQAIDELRSKKTFSADEMEIEFVDQGPDVLHEVWLDEQRATIRRALSQLPDPQRQVIELAYFQGLTQQEIAEHLGEPLGTVKTRTRLGMEKLRTTMSVSE